MVDITDQTLKAILESKLENGIVTIFVSGSTAAITTIEYEPGLRSDFPMMLNRIIPKDIEYKHDETWHEGIYASRLVRVYVFIQYYNNKATL